LKVVNLGRLSLVDLLSLFGLHYLNFQAINAGLMRFLNQLSSTNEFYFYSFWQNVNAILLNINANFFLFSAIKSKSW